VLLNETDMNPEGTVIHLITTYHESELEFWIMSHTNHHRFIESSQWHYLTLDVFFFSPSLNFITPKLQTITWRHCSRPSLVDGSSERHASANLEPWVSLIPLRPLAWNWPTNCVVQSLLCGVCNYSRGQQVPCFYATRRFVTAISKILSRIISWTAWSIPYSHKRIQFFKHISSLMPATCPAHLFFLDLPSDLLRFIFNFCSYESFFRHVGRTSTHLKASPCTGQYNRSVPRAGFEPTIPAF